MIYFDNAASGFYKSARSVAAAEYAVKELSVNAGRSGHGLSTEAEKLIYEARAVLSKTFDNGRIGRVILTSGCTEALNFALLGIVAKGREIISTVTEHNSVLRPLYALERRGYELKFARFSSAPFITANDLLPLVSDRTAFVVMNAVSNVTGYKNEYELIGAELKKRDIPFVVDGAQAAGHIPIDMKASGINALAVAGHKGLGSVQGVGALLFDESVEIEPILFGGSGNETFESVPSCYPERLEAGTHALPAILSLGEGVKAAVSKLSTNAETLLRYTDILIRELSLIEGVRLYSGVNACGIVAFSIDGLDSLSAAERLWNEYGVAVRGGFHCAPLLHKQLKTDEDGLIRASLSSYNTTAEISTFLKAIAALASS